MIRFLLIFTLFFSMQTANAQQHINDSLKKQLDILGILDQKYRGDIMANLTGKGDSLPNIYNVKKEELDAHLWKLQRPIDSLNTIKVAEIIKKYGYPGASLVGRPTNDIAFAILQHSTVIEQYLPIIKEAAEKNELRFQLYAMMLDRFLMFQDKEQVYGTQGTAFDAKDPKTGKWERFSIIWPIKDPLTVEERRRKAGFHETVEQYASKLNIKYREYKLKEAGCDRKRHRHSSSRHLRSKKSSVGVSVVGTLRCNFKFVFTNCSCLEHLNRFLPC